MSDPRRCDECGAPVPAGASRCPRCDASLAEAPSEGPVVDGPAALSGWSLARRVTAAYAVAQVALLVASALTGVPGGAVMLRAAVLAPVLGAVTFALRRRSLPGAASAAGLLGVGVVAALAFQLIGLAPRGALPTLTLGTGALWAAGLGAGAMRVWRDRRG